MLLTIVCWMAACLPVPDTTRPHIYDAVIHEIMPKPTPVAGLPPFEYIELRNSSTHTLQLHYWRLVINKREAVLPACLLPPDSMVVLCAPAAADSFHIPNVLAVDRFPALTDDSGTVALYNASRQVMHAVAYQQHWYGQTKKAGGGYSLEMKDVSLPCSGRLNWQPSLAAAGGTPGRYNTVAEKITDATRPDLYFTEMPDSIHLILHFSKTLDSAVAANPLRYNITGASIKSATVIPPLFKQVLLELAAPVGTAVCNLTATGVTDCTGNESLLQNNLSFARPQMPAPADVVISELLFNAPSGVPEFIEVYNRSNKAIDAGQLRLCARKTDGSPGPVKKITAGSRILMPGQYLACTTAADQLCDYYICRQRQQIQETGSLPSMPAAAGALLLLRADSQVIDAVQYTAAMHLELATQQKGVSLERLDNNKPAAEPGNWLSAAGTAGYATPGYENSQQWREADTFVSLTPALFSPDNDGTDDEARLTYQLPEPGWIGNVTVFDAGGRPVRYLARNIMLGNKGCMTWNGVGENAVLLPPGIYIFLIEIFNLKGRVKRWKQSLVMARKLS
ncbi:lamin tail domain-containing protein [Chitinophaga solisilvae]|uniref:lamin tail domain-containing protein n=1 Tax=Chitinophaga solisilvae TaxID=1233460 RepID=UPI001367E788|nr:lamin tail domain-containing protein [Chitinophaga solisilvae]